MFLLKIVPVHCSSTFLRPSGSHGLQSLPVFPPQFEGKSVDHFKARIYLFERSSDFVLNESGGAPTEFY